MMKHPHCFGLLGLTAALYACTSQELVFAPSCIAYEGDRVLLRGNQFEWHKFSDQVPMGADGSRVDPFPRYPLSGTYRQESERIEFKPEGGAEIDDYYLLDHRDARYLLSAEEHRQFMADGQLRNCALRLVTAK